MSQGEFSYSVGLSCQIGLLTVIDGDVSPGPSAELDLYFLTSSAITNEVEDLEVMLMNCGLFSICHWCVNKVLTSSLDSAFACILRNLEFISPSVKIYEFSWLLELIELFSDNFDLLLSLLSEFSLIIDVIQFVSRVQLNLCVSSEFHKLPAGSAYAFN